jgi:hypothetical protein
MEIGSTVKVKLSTRLSAYGGRKGKVVECDKQHELASVEFENAESLRRRERLSFMFSELEVLP